MDVLSMPPVIHKILENLPFNNVAACRLVNRTWNHEACHLLQRRIVINFSTAEDLRNFNDTYESFLDDLSITFKNFYFSSLLFSQAVQDFVLESLERLVLPISATNVLQQQRSTFLFTELLEMVYAYFPNLETLKLLLFASSSRLRPLNNFDHEAELAKYARVTLPRLRHLEIDASVLEQCAPSSCEGNDDEELLPLEHQMIVDLLKTLLTSAVNLNSISCKNTLPLALSSCTSLVQLALSQCLEQASLSPSLQKMNLRLAVTGNELRWLRSQAFHNLESAYLEVSTEVAELELKEFFAKYQGSLQRLHLAFSKPCCWYTTQFPLDICLMKLNSLTLEQFRGTIGWKLLPNLTYFSFKYCHFDEMTLNVPADWTVRKLEMEKCLNQTFLPLPFKSFFRDVAPNLISRLNALTITDVSGDVPLRTIFTQCKHLRVLSIQKCGGVTDSALCGMRASLLKMFSVEPPSSSGSDSLETQFRKLVLASRENGQAGIRENPFIGDLTGLQELSLDGEFSDTGVLYGIVHCARLIKLNLRSVICTWRSHEIIRYADLVDLISGIVNGREMRSAESMERK